MAPISCWETESLCVIADARTFFARKIIDEDFLYFTVAKLFLCLPFDITVSLKPKRMCGTWWELRYLRQTVMPGIKLRSLGLGPISASLL